MYFGAITTLVNRLSYGSIVNSLVVLATIICFYCIVINNNDNDNDDDR